MNRPANTNWIIPVVMVAAVVVFLLRNRPPALIPDPAPIRTLAEWGDAYDRGKDCRIEAEGVALAIDVPGTRHDLSGERGEVGAPRVLRPVRGDFVASVEVVGTVRPSGQPTTNYALPYHGAGLLLWQDSNNYVRLERAAILRGDELVSYVNFEQRRNGRMIKSHPMAIPDQPVTLRLERRGSRLSGSYSGDGGKHWSPMPEMSTELAADLRVGVATANTATAPFPARFRSLSVGAQASP